MKFLFIDAEAIKIIVAQNKLQSFEYNEAKTLVSFLRNGIIDVDYFMGLNFKKSDEGYFIYASKPSLKSGIVFDLSTFKGFSERREDEIITIFQKVLKFATKLWSNMALSQCEKMTSQNGHSIGILFPLPFSASKESYRIIVEKNPLGKREEKRDNNYLLVFYDCIGEKKNIDPNYTLYRKVIDASTTVCVHNAIEIKNSKIDAIDFHDTAFDRNTLSSMHLGFESWQYHLTETQKRFVYKDLINKPERLEGAAGTGKTISMILRAINLIKSNVEAKNDLTLLFITHSLSSKNQIKSILETNYPDIVNCYDRSHSPVSINVETLHEWCINNLNLFHITNF